MGFRGWLRGTSQKNESVTPLVEALEDRRLLSGGPAAPTGLGAKATTAGVSLTWTDHAKAKGTTVVVERAAGGKFHALATLSGVASGFVDGSAVGGVVYAYRVHAVRSGVSSANTNVVSVTARKHVVTSSTGTTPTTNATGTPATGGSLTTAAGGSATLIFNGNTTTNFGSTTLVTNPVPLGGSGGSGNIAVSNFPVTGSGGSFILNTGGTLTLGGPNTFPGGTTGGINLVGITGGGTTGGVITTSGGTTNFTTNNPALINTGTLVVDTGSTGTGGSVTGTGLVVNGGSLNTNVLTGVLTLNTGTLTLGSTSFYGGTVTPTLKPGTGLSIVGLTGGNLGFPTAPVADADLTGAVLKLAAATSTVGVLKLANGTLIDLNVSPANVSNGTYTFADGRTVLVVVDPTLAVSIDASQLQPGSYSVTRVGVTQPFTFVVPAKG